MNAAELKARIGAATFYAKRQSISARSNNQGWTSGGLCPFHDDSRTGNFRINLKSGGFKCFACNARGGDILDYEQKLKGIGFREAMTVIRGEFGV